MYHVCGIGGRDVRFCLVSDIKERIGDIYICAIKSVDYITIE